MSLTALTVVSTTLQELANCASTTTFFLLMDSALKGHFLALLTARTIKLSVWSVEKATSLTDSSSARKKMANARLTLTECAPNVLPNTSFSAIFASPTLKDAFSTLERIALTARTITCLKMENVSTGNPPT